MKDLSKYINESRGITWEPDDISDINDLEEALMEIIDYAAQRGKTYEGSHECLGALMAILNYGAENWIERLESMS